MSESALHALATAAGIAVTWADVFGAQQSVKDDSLRALLRALHLPSGSEADCRDGLAQLRKEGCSGQLPPLVTGLAGAPLILRHGTLADNTSYEIRLENGGTLHGRLKRTANGLATAVINHPGYHQMFAGRLAIQLAVAPQRCFEVREAVNSEQHATRPWGLAAQLYSLKRPGDCGVGDYTALESLASAAAAQGAAALAISPVHAMFSAEPARFSPYGPSSRLFFNVLHIDAARVLGADIYRRALDAVGDPALIARLESSALIDWPAVAQLKLAVMRWIFREFIRNTANFRDRQKSFGEFCRQGGEALSDHACFEALDTWLRDHPAAHSDDTQGDWRLWPAEYRHPQLAGVKAFARSHWQEVQFHQFLQWLADAGLKSAQVTARQTGMDIGIVADLAVGADPGGSQAWSLQSSMLEGLTVGAPPDLLATQGQNWGLGALSPRAMKQQGFAPWLDMLRANMRHSGGIRIDHVLGLKRLWLVPEGEPASKGAYLHYPLDDLLRLTALESMRHRAIVIGEDLGTVPEGFSEQIAGSGMLGIRALWFQRKAAHFIPAAEWPANAMATTSTHDLATTAGWWSARDLAWRDKLGLLGAGQTLPQAREERELEKNALWSTPGFASTDGAAQPEAAPVAEMLSFIGSTPAALVMVPLEDAFGVVEQPNLPGTVDVHPNWQQRLPRQADEMLGEAGTQTRLDSLKRGRAQAMQSATSRQAP